MFTDSRRKRMPRRPPPWPMRVLGPLTTKAVATSSSLRPWKRATGASFPAWSSSSAHRDRLGGEPHSSFDDGLQRLESRPRPRETSPSQEHFGGDDQTCGDRTGRVHRVAALRRRRLRHAQLVIGHVRFAVAVVLVLNVVEGGVVLDVAVCDGAPEPDAVEDALDARTRGELEAHGARGRAAAVVVAVVRPDVVPRRHRPTLADEWNASERDDRLRIARPGLRPLSGLAPDDASIAARRPP
mmetsp:Transcript_19218/g.64915  ORF Transcript_19218/g.64915 Transcript_19218/m.64915 type:complete len:241 (+) Transcript_19218:25-747(+)